MTKEKILHIHWDRIGMTALAVLLFLAEALSGNYPALMWEAIASLFMYLYFKEQDKCLNAMLTAVKCAEIIKVLTDGDKDGDTTTQP